jgi:two-component system, cell cycle sensor histidine kinase and response regulator CckA
MATVLVVDDRPVNRDLVRTLLSYRGHRVVEASEGTQALELARADPPDLVITDVLMPGMDGCELVRAMRADPDLAGVPVVFYTANYLEDEIRPIADAYGVTSILPKSSDPEVLLETVERALAEDVRPLAGAAGDDAMHHHLRTVNAKLVAKVQELESKEAALRDSETRFRRMAESAPLGLFFGDPDGHAGYVNPHLAEILGVPAALLLGNGWREALDIPAPAAYLPGIPGAVADERVRRWRQRVRRGGCDRWFDISLTTVADEDGWPLATIGTVEDVTANVEAEERKRELDTRLQMTERLEGLGRLAGGMAHDFNNLLTIILAYVKFAQADSIRAMQSGEVSDGAGKQLLDHLDSVLRAGNRGANLTAQLLTFGRRGTAHASVVDLNAVLREVSGLLERTLGEHIEIVRNLDHGLWRIVADPSQLGQILLNLAVNARDAMEGGGRLTLHTGNRTVAGPAPDLPADLAPGNYVVLNVEDTGCGMTTDVAERALDPFFTTKAPGEGTGLGLATVYGIVSRCGGRLAIRSEVGRGTSVEIYLPAVEATPTEPATADDEQEGPGGTERILIVDDEPAICALAEKMLSEAGYQVLVATSGAEALAEAGGQQHIDLLLTDVVMPRMFGHELASRLAAAQPDLRVLYMSGYADALLEQESVQPNDVVLAKPFSATALLRTVRAVLDAAPAAVRQEKP